jgi:hypothetical protein
MVAQNDLGFIEQPAKVMNVERLLSSNSVMRLDSPVDTLSLNLLKSEINKDMSIDREMANNLHNIIDYVDDRTKYMSNAQRQTLSVKDYLENYHFTSHAAYQQYADDLLKHKVEAMLGKSSEGAAMVDWQLD